MGRRDSPEVYRNAEAQLKPAAGWNPGAYCSRVAGGNQGTAHSFHSLPAKLICLSSHRQLHMWKHVEQPGVAVQAQHHEGHHCKRSLNHPTTVIKPLD